MNSAIEIPATAASSVASDRRSLRCLLLGVITGIAAGCLTAAEWIGVNPLPSTVVARVNDTDIRLVEYQRALRLFASEKRDPITDHDRALVLERMVEEELMVQHGVASGLVRGDRGVRNTVLQSVLSGLMVELEAEAGEVAGKRKSPEAVTRMNDGEIADATDTAQDNVLRQYLSQLRNAATIQWADRGSAR